MALERDVLSYTKKQRDQISDVFKSLRSTHRTIRKLLEEFSHDNPEAVDALSLLRLQLEALFVACLMLENPKYVDLYVGDYWKKTYVNYLLIKEELGALPSHRGYLETSLSNILKLRDYFGFTEEHQATIDLEQLGTPLPVGMTDQAIPWFPMPATYLGKLLTLTKRICLNV